MKHTPLCLPILFFVLIAKITNAQISTEYQSMAMEGAHWICSRPTNSSQWGIEYYSLTIKGDTIAYGKGYKKMYQDDFFVNSFYPPLPKPAKVFKTRLVVLMRDDIEQQKIFVVFLSDSYKSCNGVGEVLLHDFNLNIGDTLKYCEINTFSKYDTSSYKIDSITYKGYNYGDNKYLYPGRKILYANGLWGGISPMPRYSLPIIEGIGFLSFGPFFEFPSEGVFGFPVSPQLLRYCQGSNADCDIISSSQEIISQPLRLFPNPTEDRLYIKTPNAQPNLHVLRIYAADGKLLKQFSSLVGDYIDTSTLTPGQYYLQGIDGTGKTYSGRFIKI
jgi:hypothetical protein